MTKLLLALALASAGVAGCSKSSDTAEAKDKKAEDIPAMSVDDVDKEIAAKTVTPVDCNHDALRKAKGVLPGAVLVDSADDFDASKLPADKATKLVFYCANPG